jgi:hypothetical protein
VRSVSFPSFSPEHAFSDSCELSMCVPFKSTVVICFGNPGFRVFNSLPSISPKILSSRVFDLLTRVSRRSTTMIHFRSSPRVHEFLPRGHLNLTATIYFGSSPGVHDFLSRVLLNRTAMIHFGSLPRVHEFMSHVIMNQTAMIDFTF